MKSRARTIAKTGAPINQSVPVMYGSTRAQIRIGLLGCDSSKITNVVPCTARAAIQLANRSGNANFLDDHVHGANQRTERGSGAAAGGVSGMPAV
jgi:hypothetical protein